MIILNVGAPLFNNESNLGNQYIQTTAVNQFANLYPKDWGKPMVGAAT
jgi:hypothetical protein